LSFPLRNPTTLQDYFTPKDGVVQPFSGPIITADNGTYIVDGHHRWSAAYLIKPDFKIAAQDLGYVPTPQTALKQTQFGIVATTGVLKQSKAGKPNVFTVERTEFDEFVQKTIDAGDPKLQQTDPEEWAQQIAKVYSTFQLNLKYPEGLDRDLGRAHRSEQLTKYIQPYLWKNVELMRANNPFINDATTREVMPQVDGGTAGQNTVLNNLSGAANNGNSGVIFSFPIISYLG
jgi:hypothetical protein